MSIWKVYAKKADFNEIGKKYKIDPVIARIIRNRDVTEDNEIEIYLGKSEMIEALNPPKLMKDMEKAVDIIKEKINKGSRIRIIGDYDIDGICSIYILYRGLKHAGAEVDYVIPHRITDGYGINENLIQQAYNEGIDTIVTCDNGIAAIDQIAFAKSLGMTVVVTDHHDIPYIDDETGRRFLKSEADAIVNPKQEACRYPFKMLCGAGVAYKLVQVLVEGDFKSAELLDELTEFAAIATIGDIVELKNENRVIVKNGLAKIRNTKNTGLKALIDLCGIDRDKISTYHIGFVIGPCLNASGRLDTAERAIKMLLETDEKKAYELAGNLKALNDERKEMTQKEVEHAIELIEQDLLNADDVLVVYLPSCHESLAGIIAGRIREKYYKPVIVLTDAEEGVKGSARSIEGYNMFEEISRCRELLTKFGGHPMAAGLSLPTENVGLLKEKLNDNSKLTKDDLTPVTWIDVPMPVDYVTMDLVNQLSLLEPFGKGNEKPVFADRNLTVRRRNIFGRNNNVLKLMLENEKGFLTEAVSFNFKESEMPEIGEKISIVYYPDINSYNGRQSLQFIINEMRRESSAQ